MKFLEIIKKNFKILIRSRASAFAVIVGPLLLVALIALAFSNAQGYSISVGIVNPDQEGLTAQFIAQLESGQYSIQHYDDIEKCVENIKLQTTNVCIKFPANFVLDNEEVSEVEFFVDQSRTNLVESIISSVKSTIIVKSDEISLDLTQKLVNAVDTASEELVKQKTSTADLKNQIAVITVSAGSLQKEKDSLQGANTKLDNTKDNVETVQEGWDEIQPKTSDLLVDVKDLLKDIDQANDPVNPADTQKSYDALSPNFTDKSTDIDEALTGALEALNTAKSTVKSSSDKVGADSGKIATAAQQSNNQLTELGASQEKVGTQLAGVQITSAENIVNPFITKISPIAAGSQTSFMFPYFIMLIILFVGIMLSSTLVVMEKKSRAFFRNFTTPTSEILHIVANYLTNILVQVGQLGLIFVAAYFYLKLPLLENIGATVLILFLSLSFFIFLGAIIGYVFRTQEGTTIASISLGSLFLFLSNVILPIESFPQAIRQVLQYNPYMLCSELLRKAIIFNTPIKSLQLDLLVLGGYVIVAVVLLILAQKLSARRFFASFGSRKILSMPHLTRENYLLLESGAMVRNKKELLNALRKMPDSEYMKYVSEKSNEFALWIKDTFKEKKLAKRIRKAVDKSQLVAVLQENVGGN
ncbi:hypothetical protein COV20_02145 [Candidatus Woesearchaeota archaeon CG10_big_fil_rev_8_21_14_0_10_45_16]|nr:MAG: hypothetical protein COV20_02145 [Candidatus Woesearchaeota archaeon CG10_big_fil_rev_8_21_14_0_10_45_16]